MTNQEPLNLSVYNRAKELYMSIDELGNNIYSLDEISDILTKEVVGKKSDIILEKYIDHENNQKEINLLDKALEKISQSSSKFETIDIEE